MAIIIRTIIRWMLMIPMILNDVYIHDINYHYIDASSITKYVICVLISRGAKFPWGTFVALTRLYYVACFPMSRLRWGNDTKQILSQMTSSPFEVSLGAGRALVWEVVLWLKFSPCNSMCYKRELPCINPPRNSTNMAMAICFFTPEKPTVSKTHHDIGIQSLVNSGRGSIQNHWKVSSI